MYLAFMMLCRRYASARHQILIIHIVLYMWRKEFDEFCCCCIYTVLHCIAVIKIGRTQKTHNNKKRQLHRKSRPTKNQNGPTIAYVCDRHLSNCCNFAPPRDCNFCMCVCLSVFVWLFGKSIFHAQTRFAWAWALRGAPNAH